MYVKHLGADMLLHRASQVVGRVESSEREYLASDAVRLEPEDGTTGPRIRIAGPPPPELALLTREAVRACRGALDDLALSLVVASRRAPRSTTFPIAADAPAYLDEERRCLRHANQAARAAVRSVTPWRGGDDVLWDLHQLDASPDGPVIGLGQVVDLGPRRVPSPLGVLQPGTQTSRACLPLADDSPVADPQAPLQLVLTYGEPTRNRPLVPTLSLFIAHVAEVVEQVVTSAGHRPRTGE